MRYLLFFLFSNLLFSYITSTKIVDGRNILEFNDNSKIIIEYNRVKGIEGFVDSSVNNDYKKITYLTKNDFDEEVNKTAYNVTENQLLYFLLTHNENIFFIDGDKVKIVQFEDNIFSPIFGKVKVECKKVKVGFSTTLLNICYYENIPIYIDYKDNSFVLRKIVNDNIKNYLKVKNKLQTNINKLDFKKEPITIKYTVNKNGSISYLYAIYKFENPKNGVISIVLKGSASFIYPTDDNILVNSYLIDLDDMLFQIAGEEYINNEKSFIWKELPNSAEVPIIYKDENGENKQITFIRNNKPLYDIGGIWYLISWMNNKHKNKLLISYINKGRIQGEIKKIGNNKYVFKAFTGHFVKLKYIFELDKYNKITNIYNKNLKINIQDATTPSVIKNRNYLKNLFKSLNLKEVDE